MFNQTNLKRPAASFAAVIGLSLVLSACGGGEIVTPDPDPKPDPTPTEQVGLIKGQITPFKAGDVLSVRAGVENDQDSAIARAPVDMKGAFDLQLPMVNVITTNFNGKLISPKYVFGCDDSQIDKESSFTTGLLLLPINDLKTDKFQSIIAEVDPNSPTFNYKAWYFANMDGSLKFKGDCILRGKIDTNLNFKRGWNVVNTYTDTSAGTTTYTITSQPEDRIPWTFATAAATSLSLRGQSVQLTKNYFTPWKNLPQYQNR
ncbi:hypothetical protein [Deinococcus humi]|uniref:Lipoprotein n=1 Tax=Deinococcus humi TaxID=662880 RepID=A0A7W8JSM6_9DEIO|nr:hypothetical protein [Deinococcus humi]MBB5361046.1 hypothetical protein [Deinococcus humi]GGO18190.1 hypothetical protein GCM10008949_01150 [Deinococcus humi]